MYFSGISREFSLRNEDQYRTIGDFWDEMSALYGLENLRGLGYRWTKDKIFYAIGLKVGEISGCNFCMELPDDGWEIVEGETDHLKEVYDEIYKEGPLTYEIEAFSEDGTCQIMFYRF